MKRTESEQIIVVNATALTTGGALTILHQFLNHAKKYDQFKFFIFVSEQLDLQDSNNITFLKLNKRNWLKRIYWDSFGLKKKIESMGVSAKKIISLQNTSINFDCPQIIYLHQPLPFSGVKWSFFSRTEWRLYLYTHFYSFFIFLFVKRNTIFVVQTRWMKDALVKMHSINNDNIRVIKPDITLPKIKTSIKAHQCKTNKRYMFYPASNLIYKNHKVVLQALRVLELRYQVTDLIFQVTFSDKDFAVLMSEAKSLGVESFLENVGYVSQQEVFRLYTESDIVVFPSYIETFGLPLAEAAMLNKKIICTDAAYSRDVLEDYSNVTYVQYDKPDDWAKVIYSIINNSAVESGYTYKQDSSWSDFFEILGEKYVQ